MRNRVSCADIGSPLARSAFPIAPEIEGLVPLHEGHDGARDAVECQLAPQRAGRKMQGPGPSSQCHGLVRGRPLRWRQGEGFGAAGGDRNEAARRRITAADKSREDSPSTLALKSSAVGTSQPVRARGRPRAPGSWQA